MCISKLCSFYYSFLLIYVFTIDYLSWLIPYFEEKNTLFINSQVSEWSLKLLHTGKWTTTKILVMGRTKQKDTKIIRWMLLKVLVCPCCYRTTVTISCMRTNDCLYFLSLNVHFFLCIFKKLFHFFLQNCFFAYLLRKILCAGYQEPACLANLVAETCIIDLN